MNTPTESASPPRARARFALVLTCFLLSGFAALLYQTAWMREFSVVFGTSELAVAAVLASYMAGLALGAALAGALLARIRRPVLVYGLCELFIALGALAVPLGLTLARAALAGVLGAAPELPDASGVGISLYYLGAAFLVLLVPTTLMGATLPLLARYVVHRDDEVGSRIGMLYAANTFGAVGGTLVAAFALLPRLGLSGTVYVGVGTNAAVFLLAALLARGSSPVAAPRSQPKAAFGWPLFAMLASGFASFTYEVLWTRLLVHVVGASVFAFATMLATFLTGIALGSAIAAPLARTKAAGTIGFALCQLGIALASAATYLTLDRLPELALTWGGGEHRSVAGNARLAALVLLPATLFIGATFPFALRALARDERDAASASARLYAWNTVGAIAGAALTGFFVLPALGYAGTVRAAIYINLALAVWVAFRAGTGRVLRTVALTGAAACALGFWPSAPFRLLRSSPTTERPLPGEIAFYEVGRSTTVVLYDNDGSFALQAGGLPQGEIARHGAVPFTRHLQRWLCALPIVARPDARSLLIIGFGGGVCAEGVPEHIRTIDGIELESEVLAANRSIADQRIIDPLADPRVRTCINDARGALGLTSKRWDLIVSQPSHPWTAGASHLFTREFMQLAREHLEPGGVYVQWISTTFIDEELFKTIGATLLDSFEDVRLYRPVPSLLVALASDEPLELERQWLGDSTRLDQICRAYDAIGLNGVNDLAAALALDRSGLEAICAGAPVSTDDRNRVALQTRSQATRRLGPGGLDELILPHDPLLSADSALLRDLEPLLDRVYLAGRTARMKLEGRSKRIVETTPTRAQQRMAGYALFLARGDGAMAQRLVGEALGFDPHNPAARWALVESYLGRVSVGNAPPEVISAAEQLPSGEAAVIEAANSGVNSDWASVELLDARLASVPTTSLAYPHAARLRAEWRIRRSSSRTPQARLQLGADALQIIDRALALGAGPTDLLLRIEAAKISGNVPVMLETTHDLLYFAGPERAGSLPPAIATEITSALTELRPLMERFSSDPRVTPERVAQVSSRVDQVLAASAGF